MSLPKTTDSYPPEFLAAILRAHELGEVVIPTANPQALRLRFQGLRGALRREGKSDLADMVSFFISPPGTPESWLAIRLRSLDPLISDVASALSSNPAPQSVALAAAETSLARLLGETS